MKTKYKVLVLALITLIFLTSVAAERVTLNIGESYSDEDKNITFLKLENQKALVCVNNQKGIVAKNKRVDINGIIIELKRIYSDNSVKFYIEVPNCYKCSCTGDCLNLQCQEPKPPKPQPQPNTSQNQDQEPQKIELVESQGISAVSIIAVILITLVAILGIYVLWKRIY